MQRAYSLAVEASIRSWFADHRGLVQDAKPKPSIFARILRLIEMALRAIEASTQADIRKVERIVGAEAVGGASLLKAFRSRNVSLIKTVDEQTKAALDLAIKKFGNLHREALADKLLEVADVSRSRAKFWAVDQTLKLNADVVEKQHRSLGIEEYVWRTSGDGSVRETHAALDGTQHRYNDPPETGTGVHNPGQDYRCRCHADPVLPDLSKPKSSAKKRSKRR
jgi:SPP1 gp7 family putative phage head morphogenesis protein